MKISSARPIIAVLALLLVLLVIPQEATAQPRLACSPRPPVELYVHSDAPRHRVTVLVRSTIATGDTYNELVSIRFASLSNVTVTLVGEPSPPTFTPFTWTRSPSSYPYEALLRFERRGPGRMHAVLVVTDLCGTWRTFVGAP